MDLNPEECVIWTCAWHLHVTELLPLSWITPKRRKGPNNDKQRPSDCRECPSWLVPGAGGHLEWHHGLWKYQRWTKIYPSDNVCVMHQATNSSEIRISGKAGNAHLAVWILRNVHYDVIKWKHFCVTGHLCREFIGHRWIPRTKASDSELWCFLWSASE